MKKTLTIVMALALAVSMLASFAFVLAPGSGGALTPDKNPLVVTGFFVTTNDAIKSGARLYTALENTANAAYAKNEIIRFAITMDVLNPAVPSNLVDSNLFGANPKFVISSSTVDFSVSKMAGQQALHVPFDTSFVNAINSKPNVENEGAQYNTTTKALELVVTTEVDTSSTPSLLPSSSDFNGASGVKLYAPVDPKVAKASYAFIFTGITKGEITEQGLAKLVISDVPGSAFHATAPDDEMIKVEKNGRIYYVEKVVIETKVRHNTVTTGIDTNHPYYNVPKKVGYRVYLVGTETSTAGTFNLLPVAQLDTESITWKDVGVGLEDTEVEGLGYSLGLEKIVPTGNLTVAKVNGKFPAKVSTVPTLATDGSNQARVFRTVLSDGTVRYILGDDIDGVGVGDDVGDDAFDDTELARLNTMLADFGFSTADKYVYKLEDKYFTTAGSELDVLTATYNNGTVVPVETEEETDVEEGTEEEELEEDEDIVEDIDEELEEDDAVPATGDFAADIALALTAAAIVAAAALAFVMKKARD